MPESSLLCHSQLFLSDHGVDKRDSISESAQGRKVSKNDETED